VKEKKITEVAVSIYLFDLKFLISGLPKLKTKNAQGEYYLTDLVALAAKSKKASARIWDNADDVRGVNDLWELALAERVLQSRIVEAHARNGVRFLDPASVAVEASVRIGEGVRIHRGVVLRGSTRIGNRVDIGSNTVLRSVSVEDDVELKAGCYAVDSSIGVGAKVGPYAHLRPESHVGAGAKIGNFVELKKATIGENTSIAHLSYVGDAKIGKRVNIGCGFITCNFDGRTINGSRKHETVIEDDCFIGSDCQAVAPVKIGRGAFVASGSTITKDVEPDALAIARARQENKPGYAKKLKG
jgi:bifunctional UDP-N-acetylglucosamine pyrophosphorylase/glucosamine-1-phosphate N-acetyltransferase